MSSARFSPLLLLLLLLRPAAHGAASRDPPRSLCGITDLPQGLSVVQPALSDAENWLKIDPRGAWMCACSEKIAGARNVHFSVMNTENTTVGHVSTAANPCQRAVCSAGDWTLDEGDLLLAFNHSLKLNPLACNSLIKLYRYGDGLYAEVLDPSHPELVYKYCGASHVSVSISELHSLKSSGQNSTSFEGVPAKTVTIRYSIELDVTGCMNAAKQKRQKYFKITYPSLSKPNVGLSILHKRRLKKRNNNPPTFSKFFYKVEVAENVPVGTTVTTVQASDPDTGANGQLIYSMVPIGNVNSASYFQLEPHSGVMTTNGR